jgi:hypothetical protein
MTKDVKTSPGLELMTERETGAFKERCRAAIVGFIGPKIETLPVEKAVEVSRQTTFDFEGES